MKALIFAAGKGERLLPLTKTTPKPLTKIAGKRCIEYIIDYLNSNGITKIMVNTHHLPNQFPRYLGGRVTYSYEPTLLGTAGTLKSLQDWMSDDYIVMNGDTLSKFDLEEVMDFHLSENSPFTTVFNTITGKNAGMFIINKAKTYDWWPQFGMLDDTLKGRDIKFKTQSQYFDIGTPEKLEVARYYYEKYSRVLP